MASIDEHTKERRDALEKIRQLMSDLGWPWPESNPKPGYLLGVLMLLYQAGEPKLVLKVNSKSGQDLDLGPPDFNALQKLLAELIWRAVRAGGLRVVTLPGYAQARITPRSDDQEAEGGDFQLDFSTAALSPPLVRAFINRLVKIGDEPIPE